MKTIKTAEAEGPVLDWLVAKAKGDSDDALESYVDGFRCRGEGDYSTDWSQGGPIVEREGISLRHWGEDFDCKWTAYYETGHYSQQGVTGRSGYGPTPLIAAMRCFCVSKLGTTVEVPEELS